MNTEDENDGAHIVGPPVDVEGVLRALKREDRRQLGVRFGMPRWLYRLRFIVAGVRHFRWWYWFVPSAWGAVADDFDNGGDEQHFGYTPEESAAESLSYWDAD
jgi:hypothetical protein